MRLSLGVNPSRIAVALVTWVEKRSSAVRTRRWRAAHVPQGLASPSDAQVSKRLAANVRPAPPINARTCSHRLTGPRRYANSDFLNRPRRDASCACSDHRDFRSPSISARNGAFADAWRQRRKPRVVPLIEADLSSADAFGPADRA